MLSPPTFPQLCLLLSHLFLPFATSQLSTGRSCFTEVAPNSPGHCFLRNHLSRKCQNLQFSWSASCYNKELCCYDPAVTLATTLPTTPTTPTTTQLSTTTTEPLYRYCVPDTGSAVPDGICQARSEGCHGLAVSTSPNCLPEEVCCYNTPIGTQQQTTMVLSTIVTTTMVPSTTVTTTGTTTTKRPTTMPPTVRSCSPGSYAAITNGVCTPNIKIAQQCKGKQISPSLDCLSGEYCCFFADQPVGAGFYQAGISCSPDSNPMIGSGTCVDAAQSNDQCTAMLWSRSRNCDRGQVCCYPFSAAQQLGEDGATRRRANFVSKRR